MQLTYPIELLIYTFIFGLCIGSFLNVCIYRIPLSGSIITPRSMCPVCKQPISFFDNIPVVSYLLLGAKCRHCGIPISIRYPLIEILCGLFTLAIAVHFGFSVKGLIYYLFVLSLIVITFIDIDHQIIPDIITLPAIPLFIAASFVNPDITVPQALIGALAGGGSLYLVAEIYYRATQKEGMGGGDIKLLAMMGALIGWKGVFFVIFISSAIGTVIGLLVMVVAGKTLKLKIPFGPFLAIAAVLYLFYGQEIIYWYLTIVARPS